LRPTAEDVPLLNFLEGVELAARDLYQVALDAGVKDDVIRVIEANHRGYADAIRGRLGTQSTGRRDDNLYNQHASQFQVADAKRLAGPAYDLESAIIASHTENLGKLRGTDGARLVGAILIVEARHAAVLADLGGKGGDFEALIQNTASPLSPAASGS